MAAMSNQDSNQISNEDSNGDEDSNQISDSNGDEDVAEDDLIHDENDREPVIIVLITVKRMKDEKKKEDNPVQRELSVESSVDKEKILFMRQEKEKQEKEEKVKDIEEEEVANSGKDPILESVKDPILLFSEKHSNEEKDKEEEKEEKVKDVEKEEEANSVKDPILEFMKDPILFISEKHSNEEKEKGEKVKDVEEEEEEANCVKDPILESVKDPILFISEKHSKMGKQIAVEDKGKQILEEKGKDDEKADVLTDVQEAAAVAERKGTTVQILTFHGVNGVTQMMEELDNLSEVTLFIVEEYFANLMLKYVKTCTQIRGIPCVLYSNTSKHHRYIWNEGGSTAHRARPDTDLINELVHGNLAREFAHLRRELRREALPPDVGSANKEK